MYSRIENNGLIPIKLLLIFLFCLFITACNDKNNEQTPPPVTVIDQTLQIIPITQADGTNETLTHIGLPFQFIAVDEIDGEYQIVSDKVTWHSSDLDIASIQYGQALGLKQGVSNIHVTLGERTSRALSLTVGNSPVIALQIKAGEHDHPTGTLNNQLPVGAKQSLKAIATYADHTSYDVTQIINWRSSHPEIVTIQDATASMLKTGTTQIQANFAGVESNSLAFIVSDAHLKYLKISPTTASTAADSHTQFKAIATYSDYTSQDVTDHVVWQTSNSNIATIAAGEAEALTAGEIQVTAKLDSMTSAPANLTVTDAKLVQLQISPSETEVNIGENIFYKVKAIYDDGSTDDITDHVLWNSTDTSVTNVIAGYAKANGVGYTEVTASFNGIESNVSQFTGTDHQLIALQVTPSLVELAKGTQADLIVMATYDDDTVADVTDRVTWETHTPEVAMITHGHIAALNVGDADIHAVLNGIESNDVHVTVIDSLITALQITPATSSIAVDSNIDYSAQATFSNGTITTTQDVSHLVAWKSIHHDIATLTHGSAIGVKAGDAEILAVLNKQHNIANLNVSNKQLKSLQVTPAKQSIAVGSHTQYSATAIYDDNSTEDVSALVNWSNSNAKLVTLYSGELDAVAAGNLTISANYKGINSNQAQLEIEDIYLTSIQVTPAATDIQIGTNEEYRAIGYYSDNSSRDITHQVHWNSSNTGVATVIINQVSSAQEVQMDLAGQPADSGNHEQEIHAFASGVGSGNTFISADFTGVESNQAQLNVTAATLESLQITPAIAEVTIGTEIEFHVIGYFSDGSSKEVTEIVNWHNSHPDIMTIVDGNAQTVNAGQSNLIANIQSISSNPAKVTVSAATISHIQVTPVNASIASGNDIKYRAIAIYSDNSQQDVTEIADWQTSNTTIATVSAGDVHSITKGSVQINAHMDDITSNTANLTVTDAKLTQLQLSPTVSTVAKGNHQHYQVTGYFSDGSSKLMTQDVHWQNSAPHIATLIDGEADAFNQGSTQITVNIDGIVSNTATLNVSSAVLNALQITPANSTIALGSDQTYQAIASYSDNTTLDVTEQANWQSQQLKIATIKQGDAHSIATGQTMIMASLDGVVSNHANLTVTDAKLAVIQVTPAVSSIANGSHIHYQASGIYSDGSSRDISHLVTWKSLQPNIAVFAGDELETLNQGSATITATMDAITSNRAQLTVTTATISQLQITAKHEQVAKGTYMQFQALATYTDKSVQDVTDSATWQSSNLNLVTINSGKAHAEQQGSVIISARYDGVTSNQRELEVKQANIRAIQVSPAQVDISLGLTEQFTAMAIYTDDSVHDITSLAAWNSSHTNIATIVKGDVSTNNIGDVILKASYQGITSNDAQLKITEKVISKLQLTPTQINLAKGTTEEIHVKATYTDGSTQDVTDSINWYANNPTIGSLTGITITGVNEGTSRLYAYTSNNNKVIASNTIEVNVSAATLVDLIISPEGSQQTPSQLKVHHSEQFIAYGVYSDGSLADITHIVNWSSSDANKATVNKGSVHSEQAGIVTITASANEQLSVQSVVQIAEDELVKIEVLTDKPDLPLGMQSQFTAKLTYESGLTEEITNTNELSWSSSSASLAIDQSGVATANRVTANIIVSAIKNGIKGQATINVTDATVKEFYLQFIKPVITHDITPQSKRRIQAVAIMTDGTKNWVSWDKTTNWYEDSNGTVTTVVNGVVTGVAPGTSMITAEYRGVTTAPFIINVLQPGSYSCQEHEITVWDGRRLTFTCPITTEEFIAQGYKDRYNNRVGDGRSAPMGMNVPMVNWDTANKYCTDNGWRLPTIAELEYLQSRANTKKPKGFGVYTRFGWPINAHFWSSDAEPGTKHWLLNMYSRNPILRYDKTQYHYFSCFKPK